MVCLPMASPIPFEQQQILFHSFFSRSLFSSFSLFLSAVLLSFRCLLSRFVPCLSSPFAKCSHFFMCAMLEKCPFYRIDAFFLFPNVLLNHAFIYLQLFSFFLTLSLSLSFHFVDCIQQEVVLVSISNHTTICSTILQTYSGRFVLAANWLTRQTAHDQLENVTLFKNNLTFAQFGKLKSNNRMFK